MDKRILIIDDEASVLSTLKRLFRNKPYEVFSALSGEEGLSLLEKQPVDLIISDMRMPQMDGAEFLSTVKETYPLTERILLTGYSDMESTIKAINDGGIFGYMSKPWDVDQLLSLVESALDQTHKNKLKNRTLKRFKKQNDALGDDVERKQREMAQSAEFVDHAFQKLKNSCDVTEQMLLNLLDLKFKGQRVYADKVAGIAYQLAQVLGFSEDDQKVLVTAARLHGIGKIGVPDDVLVLPTDMMTAEQFSLYRQYPANSACTLMSYFEFQDVAEVLFEQKEYIDGSGYPSGLVNKEISNLGKILSLILDYAELRFGLTTGEALNHETVIGVIQTNHHRYDPSLLPALSSLTLEVDSSEEISSMMLPLYSLREGMVVNKDIYSDNEILLLHKNAVLTEKVIGHLINIEQNIKGSLMISVRFLNDG